MSWTDELVDQLRQAWTDGKSASQIANLLGHGLTRNAVIGKVHRLGLAGRAKSSSAASIHARSSQPRVIRTAAPRQAAAPTARIVRGATALAYHAQPLAEPEPDLESVVLPMSLRVTIIELKESMCRWPLGDPTSPDFRYCGSATQAGPYCPYHGRLAYQPADARRRDRDRRPGLRDGGARYVLPNVSSKA